MTIKAGAVNPNLKTQTPPAKIFSDDYRSNISDVKVKPLGSIVTQLSGYPISVNYYSQVIGRDQDLDGYNPTHSPLQQLKEIKELQIKLQSPFNYSMIAATGFTDFTTDAKFYAPGFIPNEGDIVVAAIGNGRLGRFEVTQALKLSIYDGAAYSVELRLMGLANTAFFDEVKTRVVEKLVYIKDFMVSGQSPLIGQEDYDRLMALKDAEHTLIEHYLRMFISKEHGTFIVPSQPSMTYDPYVTQCMLDLIEVDLYPMIRKVRNLDVDSNNSREALDIYTVLMDRDLASLPLCFKQVVRRSTSEWARYPRLGSIAHSGIATCIYPKDYTLGVDHTYLPNTTGYLGGLPLMNTAPVVPLDPTGASVPSPRDYTYVFSDSFYTKASVPMTRLESVCMDYLSNRLINIPELLDILSERPTWSQVDQFYFGPILIMLCRVAIQEI